MRAKITFTKRSFSVNTSPRIEKMNGRSYYVLPMTILKEGILAGSQGPIFYPESENKKNPGIWNGMPLVVNHPTVNGRYVSARSPDILNKYGIGFNFNTKHIDGTKKVVSEGWFDIKRVQRYDSMMMKENPSYNPILPRIKAGKKIELSTGLFATNIRSEGETYKGRGFNYIATNYRPDHIAILPDVLGACSIKDGCGVNNSKGGKTKDTTVSKTKQTLNHTSNSKQSKRDTMTRKTVIDFITANCSCYKSEKDKALLNQMSVEGLKSLKASIEERLAKEKKLEAINNKFEELTDNKLEDFEDPDEAFDVLANAMKETNEEKKKSGKQSDDSSSTNIQDKKEMKKPVTNKKKTVKSEDDEEAMANENTVTLSKDEYNTFVSIANAHKKEQEQKKINLIKQLIGNTAGMSKKVVEAKVAKYAKHSIDTLQDMLELKANNDFPNDGENDNFIRKAANFIGAGGAGSPQNNAATDEEPLVAPTINWAEKI